jgi:hypothetical protein
MTQTKNEDKKEENNSYGNTVYSFRWFAQFSVL